MSDVKITVSADASGATSELQKLAPALDQTAKATAAAGAATASATLKKKDLKDVLQALSRDVPGFGAAMALLKHPYAIAAAGIAGFVSAIRSQIDAQNQLAANAAQTAVALDPLFTTLSRRTNTAQMAADLRAFADGITAASEAARNSSDQLKLDDAAAAEQLKFLKELNALEAAGAKIAVDRQLATGQITPAQHAGRISAIDGRLGAQNSAADIAAKEQQAARTLAAAQDALNRKAENEAGLTAAARARKDAVDRATQSKILNDAQAEEEAKRLPKLKNELEATMQDKALLQSGDTMGKILRGAMEGLHETYIEPISGKEYPKLKDTLTREKELTAEARAAVEGPVNRQERQDKLDAEARALTKIEADKQSNVANALKEAETLGEQANQLRGGATRAQGFESQLNPLRARNLQEGQENERIKEQEAERTRFDNEQLRRGPRVGDGASLGPLERSAERLAQSAATIAALLDQFNDRIALIDAQVRNSRGQV